MSRCCRPCCQLHQSAVEVNLALYCQSGPCRHRSVVEFVALSRYYSCRKGPRQSPDPARLATVQRGGQAPLHCPHLLAKCISHHQTRRFHHTDRRTHLEYTRPTNTPPCRHSSCGSRTSRSRYAARTSCLQPTLVHARDDVIWRNDKCCGLFVRLLM